MCGRFTLTVDWPALSTAFRVNAAGFAHRPRYNIAPGQDIPVITAEAGAREARSMRWGLVPHWAKDLQTGYKMINARAETIDRKASFRQSFYHRRCLVPANGFYEWRRENNKKQPVRITLPGQPVFAFAGIWDRWVSPGNGEIIYSCSIITTTASEALRPVHDRMPVILTGDREYDQWLNAGQPAVLKELLRPYAGDMEIYPVSTAVNSPQADHPGLIKKSIHR